MTKRHKVFISFHHEFDELFKIDFINRFSSSFEGFIWRAVSDGDIDTLYSTEVIRQRIRDEYISDASVTVVLIGKNTWRRKHVDWEISSSIRDTQYNSRTGLIGILLPTYSDNIKNANGINYNPYTVPPRLYDNVKCGYANIYTWNNDPFLIQKWIHEAFSKRKIITPDNSYPSFSKNRSLSKSYWSY